MNQWTKWYIWNESFRSYYSLLLLLFFFFHSKTFLTHEGIRNSNKCVLHHPITLGGRLTLCQRQYLENLRNPRPNTYTPRCQQDGKFERVQCEENKCFCVDTESGRILRDTSLSKLFGEPRCDNKGKKKRIQKEKTNYFYTIITHLTNETDWNHECLYVDCLSLQAMVSHFANCCTRKLSQIHQRKFIYHNAKETGILKMFNVTGLVKSAGAWIKKGGNWPEREQMEQLAAQA